MGACESAGGPVALGTTLGSALRVVPSVRCRCRHSCRRCLRPLPMPPLWDSRRLARRGEHLHAPLGDSRRVARRGEHLHARQLVPLPIPPLCTALPWTLAPRCALACTALPRTLAPLTDPPHASAHHSASSLPQQPVPVRPRRRQRRRERRRQRCRQRRRLRRRFRRRLRRQLRRRWRRRWRRGSCTPRRAPRAADRHVNGRPSRSHARSHTRIRTCTSTPALGRWGW